MAELEEKPAEAAEPVETDQEPLSPAEDRRADIQAAIEKVSPTKTEEGGEKPNPEARDTRGRFQKPFTQRLKHEGASPTVPPGTATKIPPAPGVTDSKTGGAEPLKAPGGWRPAAREKWAAVPPEVQQEIKRLEREQAEHGQKVAPALKFQAELQKTIAPFEATIRAEMAAHGKAGEPALAAFGDYLAAAQALRSSHPEGKAAILMNVVGQYGVPPGALIAHLIHAYQQGGGSIESLDAEVAARLQGRQPQTSARPQVPAFDPAAFEQSLMEKLTNRATLERATGDAEAFAAENDLAREPEIREAMAKMLESGIAKTFDSALSLALRLPGHEEFLKVQEQRRAAQEAKQQGSTQAARRASSSIRGSPTGRIIPKRTSEIAVDDRREDIRAAMARVRTGQ